MKTVSLGGLYSAAARQRLRPGGFIARLIEPADAAAAMLRDQADTTLAQAHDEGWLDYPTVQRLASGDDMVMLAALRELEVACFLRRLGATLMPNPPGRGRHIGEFLVTLAGVTFFLEVKTLGTTPQEIYRSDAERAIIEAAAGVPIPAVLEVELQSCPASGVSIRDLRFYLDQATRQLLAGWHVPPAYIHRSGMAMRVLSAEPLGNGAQAVQVRFVGWDDPGDSVTSSDRRQERLLRALRGAYEQLPQPAELSMVVVTNQNSTNDHESLVLSVLSSFLRPDQHRRLSAVGCYASDRQELLIVHNQWATCRLPEQQLLLPAIRQASVFRAST